MDIQRKLIGYSGVTQDGNDYASKDGELAVCQGVVNEDGGLRKIVEGADIGLVLESGECVYLHRNVGMGKHYIVLRNDNLQGNVLDWYKEDLARGAEAFLVLGTEEYAAAAAIGNILIVTTDKKKYYCLWKDGAYSVLGNDLPEIEIQFTTHGYFGSDGKIVNSLGNVLFEDKTAAGIDAATQRAKFKKRQAEARWESLSYNIGNYVDWPSVHWQDTETASVKEDESYNDGKNWPKLLTDKCYNLLNGVIRDAKEQGLFVMPRLVRAAWRLYDGKYAKFTTPVLVFNNGTHHLTALEGTDKDENGTSRTRNICASVYPYTIDYYIKNSLSELVSQWGDLIKGISFFTSSEVYDYDQQGEITTLRKTYTHAHEETVHGDSITLYDIHYSAELPRPSTDAQLVQLRNGGPFYAIYDKELSEASTRYVLLQLKRVVDGTPGEDMPTRIGARSAAFEIRYNNSASQLVGIDIASGDTLDNIAKKIEDELRRLGLKIRVSRMYAPKARAGKKTYTREIGLALVPMEDVSLDILSFGTDPDSTDTLDMFAVNCCGSPLPSESLPLKTLETQTHINDDYLQHVDLLPRVMAAYNNRLNMGNLEVKYRAYPCAINNAGWYQSEPGSGYLVVNIWYYIKTSSGDVIVSSGDIIQNTVLHYLYYPDKRCYKAVVECAEDTYPYPHYYLQVPMKPSDLLNGAVFIDRMPYYDMVVEGEEYVWRWHWKDELADKVLSSFTEPTEGVNEGIEELKNVILTTHTDNPLNWDASLETSVGNGEILATAPNTRALSEGQYGQHPMYAFTTDEGVWAIQIGSDGQLVPVQAVTRDTLTDKKSILQLDTSILFGTERGIMELAGSKSACMTDKLTGKGFDVTQLKGYATLLEAAGMTLDELPSSSVDFRQFVRGCRMAYDYINQRIYVWNPKVENNSRAYNYAYIYSIKGKSWGVIGCTLKEPLNTYPESLVTTDDRKVVKLGAEENSDNSSNNDNSDDSGDSGNVGKALIVTRPLKVDSLDGLKTLYEVWQRGMIRPADDSHWVKQALYGSRDMYNWRLVGSSNTSRLPSLGGSPYKYYRVVIVASMGDDEFIEGCEIRWRPKHNKSLR